MANMKRVSKALDLFSKEKFIEAEKAIKNLNKKELVEMMVNTHRYETASEVAFSKCRKTNLLDFIGHSVGVS